MLSNRDVLLGLLKDWNSQMTAFTDMLEHKNGEGIEEAFRQAREFRSILPERRKGMISPLFDLYTDVQDAPGMIGKIATELGANDINLSNLEIIENRVDVPGIMRLSFRQEEDMERAKTLLDSLGYQVWI